MEKKKEGEESNNALLLAKELGIGDISDSPPV